MYTTQFASGQCATRDNEGNVFKLCANGEVKSKISVSFHMDEQPKSPEFSEEEFFDPVNQHLPLSQYASFFL